MKSVAYSNHSRDWLSGSASGSSRSQIAGISCLTVGDSATLITPMRAKCGSVYWSIRVKLVPIPRHVAVPENPRQRFAVLELEMPAHCCRPDYPRANKLNDTLTAAAVRLEISARPVDGSPKHC